jgi:hypothetical protein
MVTDVGDSEGVAAHPFTGAEVRAQIIKYLADSLRDLPGEGRTFVYLGRVLVGTEWSRWMQHVEPVTQSSGHSAFRFAYKFHPAGEWDAEILRNRLSELWRIWGWNCAIEDQPTAPEYSVVGRSPEGHELTFRGRPERRASNFELFSSSFVQPGNGQSVTMPFAVSPFGPLSLPTVWAVCPELITW